MPLNSAALCCFSCFGLLSADELYIFPVTVYFRQWQSIRLVVTTATINCGESGFKLYSFSGNNAGERHIHCTIIC